MKAAAQITIYAVKPTATIRRSVLKDYPNHWFRIVWTEKGQDVYEVKARGEDILAGRVEGLTVVD